MSTTAHARGIGPEAVAAEALTGVALGALILLIGGLPLKWMLVVAAALCLPALWLVLGSMTRMLQALLILSLAMSIDVHLGFSEAFANTRPGVPVTLTAILLLALYGLRLTALGPRPTPIHTRAVVTVPFALLMIWAVSSLWVAPRSSYVIEALPGYLTAFVLYLYAVQLVASTDDLRFTVRWIAIAVLFSGALGLVQYVTGGWPSLAAMGGKDAQIVQDYQHEQISRVSGLLHHPNTFAIFLNGFLPLLLVMASTVKERWFRLLCGAAFGLGTAALVLTYSRGGWISFAVSLALFVTLMPKQIWRPGLGTALVTVLSLSLVVVVLAVTPLYSRVVTRMAEDDQGAAQSRMALLRTGLDLVRQYPIVGVGLGNYQFASPVVVDDRGVPLIEPGDGLPMRAHNLFLLTAVELGIPGALLLIATVLLFFVQAIPVIRTGAWLPSRIAVGFTCGLAAILMHCMLEPATLADPSYLILSLVGGCVTGLKARSTNDD